MYELRPLLLLPKTACCVSSGWCCCSRIERVESRTFVYGRIRRHNIMYWSCVLWPTWFANLLKLNVQITPYLVFFFSTIRNVYISGFNSPPPHCPFPAPSPSPHPIHTSFPLDTGETLTSYRRLHLDSLALDSGSTLIGRNLLLAPSLAPPPAPVIHQHPSLHLERDTVLLSQ